MDFSSRKENLDLEMAMPPAGPLLASSVKAKKYSYLVPWKPKNTGCSTSGVPAREDPDLMLMLVLFLL